MLKLNTIFLNLNTVKYKSVTYKIKNNYFPCGYLIINRQLHILAITSLNYFVINSAAIICK